MTPVLFHFVTPAGVPLANALVEVQLSRAAFDIETSGVLMPRLVEGTTDADGRLTLALWAHAAPYIVSVQDPVSDAGLSYKFFVPEQTAPVRLQDIVIDGPMSNTTYDEAALIVIHAAKASALTSQTAAAASADSAAASASGVTAGVVASAASASAASVSAASAASVAAGVANSVALATSSASAANLSQIAAAASEVNAVAASVGITAAANSATASAVAAAESATTATTQATAATTSATNAAAAAVTATGDATTATSQAAIATAQATTATTKAEEASTSAATATVAAGTATTKASEAGTSATSSLASSVAATASQGSATAAAVAAAVSATTTSTQAGIATTKAAEAVASATSATSSASTAAAGANTATVKAGEAVTSALNAAASAAAAASSAGAATAGGIRYDTAQSLTGSELTQAKSNIGFSSVNNTSDVNKPVSTAQAAADTAVQAAAATDATTKANAASASAQAASAPVAHVGSSGTSHATATTTVAGYLSAADKTKLDGVAAGATNYTHPANHPPTIISQDASNRFVTDAQMAAWNAKQAELVSGTNIKTIGGASVLGLGDIAVSNGITRSARTINTELAVADRGALIDITGGTFTQTFSSVATLTAGWFCYIRNSGAGVITLDPNLSELIDGLSTRTLTTGQVMLVVSAGTELSTVAIEGVGNHVITAHTGNGQASINTGQRRFTTIQTNVGTAITYADSATLGATFTINESGIYSVHGRDAHTLAGMYSGITRNATVLDVGVNSLSVTAGQRVCLAGPAPSATFVGASDVVRLVVGDVIRFNSAGNDNTSGLVQFSIRKVGL